MKLHDINRNTIHKSNVMGLVTIAKAALKFGATKADDAKTRLQYMIVKAENNPNLDWVKERTSRVSFGIPLVGRKPSADEINNGKAHLAVLPEVEVNPDDFKSYVLEDVYTFYSMCYWFCVKHRKYAYGVEFDTTIASFEEMDTLWEEAKNTDFHNTIETWWESRLDSPVTSGVVPDWIHDTASEMEEKVNAIKQFYAFFDSLSPSAIQEAHNDIVESHKALIKQIELENEAAMRRAKRHTSELVDDSPTAMQIENITGGLVG